MSKRQLYLVARQTYLNRFKTFGFWSVVLAPLLVVLVIFGITWVIDATQSHEQPTVAVVANQPLNNYLKQNKAVKAKFKNIDSLANAKHDLKKDKIDGYLTSTENSYALKMSVDAENLSETTLQATLDQYHMLSQANKMHLTPNQLNSLVTKPDFQTSVYSISGKSSQGGQATNQANQLLSAALGIFIFIFLSAYVGMISQEIANEKSSRIMEILLAVTSPGIQFFGKLLGIAGLAITHGLIYFVVVGVIAIFFGDNEFVKTLKGLLTGVDAKFAIMTGFLTLIGIFLYMVVTAIVSAMVNDLSQVQQAVAPISYFSMIGYILTFVLNGQPHNSFINALSYVPFISQTLMPARLGLQYANMTDAFIALVLELIVLIFLARYGLRVYKRNVLTYNDGNITKAALLSLKGLFSKKQ